MFKVGYEKKNIDFFVGWNKNILIYFCFGVRGCFNLLLIYVFYKYKWFF